jgi:hypothetical protein
MMSRSYHRQVQIAAGAHSRRFRAVNSQAVAVNVQVLPSCSYQNIQRSGSWTGGVLLTGHKRGNSAARATRN